MAKYSNRSNRCHRERNTSRGNKGSFISCKTGRTRRPVFSRPLSRMGELRGAPGWPGRGFAARGRRGRGRRAYLIERRDPKLYAKLENLIQTIPWNWPDKAIERLEEMQGTLMKAEERLEKQKGPAWGDLPLFRGSTPRDPDPEGELAGEMFSLQEEVVSAIMEAQEMIDDGAAYADSEGTYGEGSGEFTDRMEEIVSELEASLSGNGGW